MIVNSNTRPCSKLDLKLDVMISFSENVRIIMRVFYTFHIRTGLVRAYVCIRRKSPLYHDSIRHNHSHNSIVKLLWRILFILLGFVCLSTPFDLHVSLKYTKCCIHRTMTLHNESAYSFCLTNASCEISWWINLFDLDVLQAITTSKIIEYSEWINNLHTALSSRRGINKYFCTFSY